MTTNNNPQKSEVIETPRTDAEIEKNRGKAMSVSSDFAKNQERALISAEKERDALLLHYNGMLEETYELTGIEVKTRGQNTSALLALKQDRDSILGEYRNAVDKISDIKPPSECPFCETNNPCSECYVLARIQGQLASLLNSETAKRILESQSK